MNTEYFETLTILEAVKEYPDDAADTVRAAELKEEIIEAEYLTPTGKIALIRYLTEFPLDSAEIDMVLERLERAIEEGEYL